MTGRQQSNMYNYYNRDKKRMTCHHKILQTAEFGWQLSITWQFHHGFCQVHAVMLGSLTSDLTCCQTYDEASAEKLIWSEVTSLSAFTTMTQIQTRGSTSSSSVNGDFVLILCSVAHFIQEANNSQVIHFPYLWFKICLDYCEINTFAPLWRFSDL